MWRPYYLALLAEAYGKAGQVEEGLTALAEALAVVEKTGERLYEAELYRLYGELSLRGGETETGRTGKSKKSHPLAHPPFAQSVSRRVLPESHRHCPETASQIARTARHGEPRTPLATTRQDN